MHISRDYHGNGTTAREGAFLVGLAPIIVQRISVSAPSLAADPPSPNDVASDAARTARRGSNKHCHSSIFLLITFTMPFSMYAHAWPSRAQAMNIIARILGNYIHCESDWSV